MANERLSFGGVTMDVLAGAEDTGGAMTAIVEVPPLLDTPAHVHANEDELFIAIEGEHVITRGEEEITIGPGEADVRAPRRPARAAAGGRGRGADHVHLHPRRPGGLLP